MKRRFEPVEGRNLEIIEAVLGCDEVAGLAEDLKFNIRLCVEEVEENILGYSGTTWVDVETYMENGWLVIGFRDGGVEFDPLAMPEPDINAPLEQRQIGGLGIFLCKKIMNEVEYRFENGCNMFVMKLNVNNMDVIISKDGDRTVAVVSGRIDTTNADKFQKAVNPLMEEKDIDLELDCTDLEYTSSQGLRIFLMLQKKVTANGGRMVMSNMHPQVKRVFDITGFSNIIRII